MFFTAFGLCILKLFKLDKKVKKKKTLAHPYIISSVRPLNNLTLTFSATNCLFTATALEGFVYRNGPRQ